VRLAAARLGQHATRNGAPVQDATDPVSTEAA
jgi:hypothetical protein